jgi:PAS domain S-box-containing protein
MAVVESELGLSLHPRLAALATSPWPAWLWSADASRILWANAAGAAVFGAATVSEAGERRFAASQPAAAQIQRLAATLPSSGSPRLERLRQFGAGFGRALTCACSRIILPDGRASVLVAATEAAGPVLTLSERVRRLLSDRPQAVAVFAPDGALIHATDTARQRLRGANTLSALGVADIAAAALATGRASGLARSGQDALPVTVERLGEDLSRVLVVVLPQQPKETVAAAEPTSDGSETRAAGEPVVGAAAEQQPQDQLSPAPPLAPIQPLPASGAKPADASHEEAVSERRHPLRFVWQMDTEGRFVVGSDEFIELVGPRTMASFGRHWRELAAELKLDPDNQFERATATRETWSGITLQWPIDETDERLPVELAGLPVFDRDRLFRGYRGFGVCRDIARINQLARLRRDRPIGFVSPAESADAGPAPETPAAAPVVEAAAEPESPPTPAPVAAQAPEPAQAEAEVSAPPERPAPILAPVLAPVPAPLSANVVPFRPGPAAEPKSPGHTPSQTPSQAPSQTPSHAPSLSPIERHAFRELAQELTARLRGSREASAAAEDAAVDHVADEHVAGDLPAAEPLQDRNEKDAPETAPAAASAHGAVQLPAIEPLLLDRSPVGVLVYRNDQFVFANRQFFELSGFESLDALAAAGGLAVLFDGPAAGALTESDGAQSLSLVRRGGDRLPVEGRLSSIPWQEDTALALFLTNSQAEERHRATAVALAAAQREIHALKSILDTTMDGVIVLDRDAKVLNVNAGAQALFGISADEAEGHPLVELLTADSESAVRECFERVARGETVLHSAVDVTGRAANTQVIPLAMIVARIGADRFCAAFRDATAGRKVEEELRAAKRDAQKSAAAKADFLAKVSHEIRTPLNAITGFAEVIMAERFGPIGNERYREYLKDMHAAGAHLVSLLNDLLDLSKIETGKLDLNFANVNLNDIVQQCVGIMQPQANRARIIIRSSLTPGLPHIVADERSLRQIALNLLGNSIRFTGPGGQVIVSTAVTDAGEAVLRVRDTGVGMTEKDIQTAVEPFRQVAISGSWGSGGTGLGLPLTKALAEANRANFSIKSSPNAGTLVEIAFPPSRVLVE